MRCVASSVAVITTDGPAGRHGATVSSHCSVSADPPTMLVCLNQKSKIASQVKQNGQFCINVLSHNMQDIAERFAGFDDAQLEDRFAGIDAEFSICPKIQDAVHLLCEVDSIHLSGTHWITVGRVVDMSGNVEFPLTYLNGEYWKWRRHDAKDQ